MISLPISNRRWIRRRKSKRHKPLEARKQNPLEAVRRKAA
jgi:hypothetical protein